MQQMAPNVEQILNLSLQQQEASHSISDQLSSLSSVVQSAEPTATTTELLANRSASDQQHLLGVVEHTSSVVTALSREWCDLRSMVRVCRTCYTTLPIGKESH